MTVSLRNTPLIETSTGTTTPSVASSWNGTSPVANDFLVAVMTLAGNATPAFGAAPTGWTLTTTVKENTTDCATAIYTRTATGDSGDNAPSFTGTLSGGTAARCAGTVVLYDFYDSSGATPVIGTYGIATGTSGTVSPVTSGNVAAGSYAVSALSAYYTSSTTTFTWTTPTNEGTWTSSGDSSATAYYRYAHWRYATPTAGSTLTCAMAHSAGTTSFEAGFVFVVSPPTITSGPPLASALSQPAGPRVSLVRTGLVMASLLPMAVVVPPTSGPPVTPLAGPVGIHKVLPPRGKVHRRAGTFGGTGPPVLALRSPVGPGGDTPSTGTQPAGLPRAGRVYGISHAGTFGGTGPPVPALHSPVQAADANPAGGQHLSRTRGGVIVRGSAGTRGNLGPPVRPLASPVRAVVPARVNGGSIRHLAGVYATLGPPVKPLHSPVRAPIPARSRGGTVTHRAGTYDGTGPKVKPLTSPVRAAAPRVLPARGRVAFTQVTAVQAEVNVIAVYGAIPAPVRAALPVTLTGRHAASPVKAGIIIAYGPPVTPLRSPVRAPIPGRPRGGTVAHRAGAYAGTGEPVTPLREPVRAPIPARTRGGTAISRAGVYDGTGPAVTPLRTPVRALRPLPPAGRVYGAVKPTAQLPPPVSGAPVPARAQPWRAQLPPPQVHGFALAMGTLSVTAPAPTSGPPVTPLRSPVRAPIPAAPRGGSGHGSPGTFTAVAPASGPPVAPLRSPVRAPVPQHARGGTIQHLPGSYSGTGPPVPPLAQPAGIRVIYARAGHIQQSAGAVATPFVPVSGPPIAPRGQPIRATLPPPSVHGSARAMGALSVTTVAPVSGPPIPARNTPWRAAVPARSRGGTIRSGSGTRDVTGPPVKPLTGPVRAAWPRRVHGGTVMSRQGIRTEVAPTSGPPIPPYAQPHRASLPPPTYHGSARAMAAIPAPVYVAPTSGPPVAPLRGPVCARQPLPGRGRVIGVVRAAQTTTFAPGLTAGATAAAPDGTIGITVQAGPAGAAASAYAGTVSAAGEATRVTASVTCAFQAYSSMTAQATVEFMTGQPVQEGLVTLASDPWTSMYPGVA